MPPASAIGGDRAVGRTIRGACAAKTASVSALAGAGRGPRPGEARADAAGIGKTRFQGRRPAAVDHRHLVTGLEQIIGAVVPITPAPRTRTLIGSIPAAHSVLNIGVFDDLS